MVHGEGFRVCDETDENENRKMSESVHLGSWFMVHD